MSCILHCEGRVGQISDQKFHGADVVLFSVCSRDSRMNRTTHKNVDEWTTFIASGTQAERMKRFIQPNDFVSVVAKKVTEKQVDADGNESMVTTYRVLPSQDCLMRIHRPWKQKLRNIAKKNIDENTFGEKTP